MKMSQCYINYRRVIGGLYLIEFLDETLNFKLYNVVI